MGQTYANYGIDAPDVVKRLVILGLIGMLFGMTLIFASNSMPRLLKILTGPALSIGFTFLLAALLMIWGSKFWKLRLRDKMINELTLRGDEVVLDVGCGHGLLLIGAAKRLTKGKAVGIDLWQQKDQAGNSAEATMANAHIEGVADRIELKDGDMRDLPFEDKSFDVIVSSWAIHNIYEQAGREKAIREIVRVLRPGGRISIVDIRHAPEYALAFAECGMKDVQTKGPNFLFVIPSYRVIATKQD